MKWSAISVLFSALLLISSCSARKATYLNDLEDGIIYPADVRYEPTVQRDDRLDIKVSCKSPELALPFNSPLSSVRGESDGVMLQTASSVPDKGYLVDVDGNIVFPLLGTVHIEGMTLKQAASHLRSMIIEGGYIKDPTVVVEFVNFKYTVLGAVGRKGVFSSDSDRVTVLEAIAQAGDLAQNARLDGVCIIRETDGQRQIYTLDVRTKDLFSSPAYYLRQNDIVYVQPRYKKMDGESRAIQYLTIGTSAMSAAALILTAVKAFSK